MSTPRNTILLGDAALRLMELEAGSVDCVITSPPYFRLRDYQHDRQLGMESTVTGWTENLRTVMHQLARVLVPTGTVWLNLGDTYSTHPHQGAAIKSLLLGPERLALALIEDGWTVRNKIIWAKTNPIPTSVIDRLATTHEVIYLLTRSRRYYFALDAIRQPPKTSPSRPPRQPGQSRRRSQTRPPSVIPAHWLGSNTDTDSGLTTMKQRGITTHPLGKNPGDVWQMSTANYRGDHFATYPEHLAERMLLAGVPEQRCTSCRAPWHRPLRRIGNHARRLALRPTCHCDAPSEPGLVLDPFIGSGTTAITAIKHHRDWLGIEINPDFAYQAQQRITTTQQQTTKDT